MELEKNSLYELASFEMILNYEIDSYSSFEEPFFPNNIIHDSPSNPDARWASLSNSRNEYIILKLACPVILTSISFGKYKKPHNNNLREFKIYIGNSKDEFKKVLGSVLKNDSISENFLIDYKQINPMTCQFIKIKPISSWGENIRFSIWSIKLKGINDQKIVEYHNKMNIEKNREISISTYLDFLMENKCQKGIECLKKSDIFKMNPDNFIEKLYEILVIREEYDETLNFLRTLSNQGVFNEYVFRLPYHYQWTFCKMVISHNSESSSESRSSIRCILSENRSNSFEKENRENKTQPIFVVDTVYNKFKNRFENSKNIPRQRGGHQMCIDEETDKLYLFGGFYGKKNWDMPDFWSYNLENDKWKQILPKESDTWPSPRCCHCISYDFLDKKLYIIGGLVSSSNGENNEDAVSNMRNDFYVYDFKSSQWSLISLDTFLEFGPMAISSGQMCIDVFNKMLYVFGGRTDSNRLFNQGTTSIIYSYDIKLRKWETFDLKKNNPEKIFNEFSNIYENECYGHCMLLNPKTRDLLIYGGIVKANLISDFFSISTVNYSIKRIQFPEQKLPNIAFHKGCYNSKTDSFYYYSGYLRSLNGVFQTNHLFECNLTKNTFRTIYEDCNVDRFYWYEQSMIKRKKPMPRFSHQFLYHSSRDEFYLFGGNPNQPFSVLKERLNDFWKLKIKPQGIDILMKKMELWVKKLKILTLIKNNSMFDNFEMAQMEFQELNELAKEVNEASEMENIIKATLLWGPEEIEHEKMEVFKRIKSMCHCERIKKRKLFLSYLDY